MSDNGDQSSSSELRGKVLYIEDNLINMELIETALAVYPGVTLIKAHTGMQGIELARSERPDFVLLDMHLPDIGGLEVVRALNEEIASGKLRVTLLTADTLSMDIVKAMSLGAYDYWLKPLSMVKFEAGLRRALTRKDTAA
ncbi:response regulator [Piscinibacter sp.]|uniref:response regulator n=1 Tax=Piscinibacter sp. TaxID=1903157 RepID=UPI002B777B74|nr:response regulator [Albitalea sp.]HUG24023.1 response regulator [Albitalea sp.]